MDAAENNGGEKSPPTLHKPMSEEWANTHRKWKEIYDSDRYGYCDGDDTRKWTVVYIDTIDSDYELHHWCFINCRDRFISSADPMAGYMLAFSFQNAQDAVLFKLSFGDIIDYYGD